MSRTHRLRATTTALLISALALSAVTALVLVNAQDDRTGTTGETEVELWHTMNPTETETLESVLVDFERAHPGVDVVSVPIGFDGAREKVHDALRSRTGPDVVRTDVTWLPTMASEGLLAPLDDLVDADRFTDPARQLTRWSGHHYGVPQTVDVVALLGNRELLAAAGVTELPATYEGLASACSSVGSGRGVFLRGEAHFVTPWLTAFGGGTVDVEGRRILVSSLPSLVAVDAYHDLYTAGCSAANEDFASEARRSVELFASGEVAMVFEGPWATAEILSAPAFAEPDNLLVGMPQGPAGGGSVLGAHSWSVASDSNEAQASRDLAEWLGSPGVQTRFADENHLLPTDQEVLMRVVADDPVLAAFAAIAAASPHTPPVIDGGAINAELTPRIHRVLNGEDPPLDALIEVGFAYQQQFPGFEEAR